MSIYDVRISRRLHCGNRKYTCHVSLLAVISINIVYITNEVKKTKQPRIAVNRNIFAIGLQ